MALLAIILIVLDYAHEINIISPPYSIIDNSILIVFAIDYFVRLLY